MLQQIQVYGDGRCLFRCIASRLNTTLLLCERNEGGMPLDPRLQKLESKLADTLRTDTVNTLKANLHFLDDALVQALCEKQNGQHFVSLEERLRAMESHDEYAGELEIRGLVYSSCCPIFLYRLVNGIPLCYIQYGDDLFPQTQPIKILYHPDQADKPGHYDLLIDQFDKNSAKSVIDQNSAVGSSLNLLQHLCKSAGSITSEVQIVDVIKDIKISEKKTEENEPITGLHDQGKKIPDWRTLKEANIVLSLDSDNQFSKGISARVNQYAHLSLQEFKLNEAEIEAKNKLSAVIFEFSLQCSVAQISLPDDDIFLPSFRKRFGIESRQSEHQSQITYLRIINEPADNKETILKVINFLYNVYDVETTINHLVVIGDAKTYELLRKLKDEYGRDLN